MDLINYFKANKKLNINVNDYNNYIDDDHKHFKIISNQIDNNLDEVKDNFKLHNIKESNIKDFDNLPQNIEKYKIREINQSDFNNEFLGFDDPVLNYKGTRKIENAYLYGEPTSKEIMISNLQNEAGTSNIINQKKQSIETGESIEDIINASNYIDKQSNNEVENILNQIEKEKTVNRGKVDKILTNRGLKKELTNVTTNKKFYKANIQPIVKYNKEVASGNEIPNKNPADIIEDDRVDKKMASAEKETKASQKIQKFAKIVKGKKEGKEMIKNIIDQLEHKNKLNKVFDEATKKYTKKDKVVNYNKIFPIKKNKKIDYTINPLIKKPELQTKQPELETKSNEEPQRRGRGRPRIILTEEQNEQKKEAIRKSDRIRKANKKASSKAGII